MKRLPAIGIACTALAVCLLAVTLWGSLLHAAQPAARAAAVLPEAGSPQAPAAPQPAAVPPPGPDAGSAVPAAAQRPYTATLNHRDFAGIFRAKRVGQYLQCKGPKEPIARERSQHEPPLIVMTGLNSGVRHFASLTKLLRASHYVCAYDRPGIERSPARTGSTRVTAQLHARELAGLLKAAGIKGKTILVPHSYSGLVAQAYAQKFPDRVAGLALLDTPPPGMGTGDWSDGATQINVSRSQALVQAGPRLGPVPLLIVSSDDKSMDSPEHPASRLDAFGSNALHTTAVNSVHEFWHAHPNAVAVPVRTLVDAAVTGMPMPKCAAIRAALAAADSACHRP